MKTKKIAIIGAPGVGKTTLSAGLFYNLKIRGFHVELVPELIKYKVYQGNNFSKPGFDIQNTLEQLSFEETFEKAYEQGHSLEYMICEAPLCNGYFYASFYKKNEECPVLKRIAREKIKTYDLFIFVKRSKNDSYVQAGRKESLEESIKLEKHILRESKKLGVANKIVQVYQTTNIENLLMEIEKV